MDAKEFLDTFGWEEALRVAKQAGTTREYYYQIANGYRNASPRLAERLVQASNGRLDFRALVFAKTDPDAAA